MGASYREDGEVKLQDKVTKEKFEEIFDRAGVQSASLHKPGSEIVLPNGKRYVVLTDGSWAQVVNEQQETEGKDSP
jgi:hypothetical protein